MAGNAKSGRRARREFNSDPDWLRRKAAQEDGCNVNIGAQMTDTRSPIDLGEIEKRCETASEGQSRGKGGRAQAVWVRS